METVSATLIISSASRLQAISARPTLLPAGPALAAGGTDGRARQTYRVEDPAQLLSFRRRPWSPAGQRPDREPDHDPSRFGGMGGGPRRPRCLALLDSIHLKLPTTWALRAQVDLAGGRFRHRFTCLIRSCSGSSVRSGRSGGLSALALARHSRSYPARNSRFPIFLPLGRGVADTYLGLVDATGSTLTTAGSSGLHEIRHASRFKDEEFGDVWEPTPGRFMSSGTTGR